MSIERTPMLKGTLVKLTEELKELKTVSRPKVIQEISEARANGDLSENADYHAAREKQGEIEAKIKRLEGTLSSAEVIEASALEMGHIIIGAQVTIENLNTKAQQTYTLVGPEGIDALSGKISVYSPIGKGLMGKKVNDIATIETPKGELSLKIISFE